MICIQATRFISKIILIPSSKEQKALRVGKLKAGVATSAAELLMSETIHDAQ